MTVRVHHGLAHEVLEDDDSEYDLIITDPPYSLGGKRDEWQATSETVLGLNAAADHLGEGGAMIVFSAASGRGFRYIDGAIPLTLSRLLVWRKRFVNSPVAGPWRWDIVPILVYGRGTWGRPEWSSCYETEGPVNGGIGDSGHPAEVPLGLAEWLTRPYDTGDRLDVLDPFLGSGSLLVPSRRRGWTVVGVEKDEEYAERARARLEGTRVSGGAPVQERLEVES